MNEEYTIVTPSKISPWRAYLPGNTVYCVSENTEPCWLHRKMQELCFGIKWRKDNSSNNSEAASGQNQ